MRTLIHELCHHLDYELLRLADSFHTEGFYKRESSLVHQLVENKSLAILSNTTIYLAGISGHCCSSFP